MCHSACRMPRPVRVLRAGQPVVPRVRRGLSLIKLGAVLLAALLLPPFVLLCLLPMLLFSLPLALVGLPFVVAALLPGSLAARSQEASPPPRGAARCTLT